MSVLYVTEQGSYLYKRGSLIIVKKKDQIIHSVHAFKLDQLILMGNISLSPGAIAFLLAQGIDTVFMSLYGKYKGRLISHFSKNVELRKLQFEKMGDEKIQLILAKAYTMGKITNCRILLRRHNSRHKNDKLTNALHKIRTLSRQISQAPSIASLMGYEGKIAAIYFSAFGCLFKEKDINFKGRNRRPPKDPANVLLSLGYTLLENVIQTQINITGLDPYLGCFHGIEYGRASLVLDLMEEFRPVIVDTLVVQLINKRIIRITDFYKPEEQEPAAFDFAETETAREDLPILLTHTGMRKFITQFEARINQKVLYEPKGISLSYRDIFLEQVRTLVRHLKGEQEYISYTMR